MIFEFYSAIIDLSQGLNSS